MADQIGIDATKQALKDLEVIVPAIIKRAKDGVGVDDLLALGTDTAFRAAVTNLVANAKAIPAEAKDISAEEGVELLQPTALLIVAIIKAARA